MKNLHVTWDGIADPTGYLFSFAKSLSCAVKNSPWAECAEDIIATSGFAFRMWVADDLCVSATSIWGFDGQKPWVENGGLTCDYVGRYWGQDNIEEEKRLEAIVNIKKSIDNGIPAISWDIGIPEWGLITGYNDTSQTFDVLPAPMNQQAGTMAYDILGKRELPLLSVLTITGKKEKTPESILYDTKKLAAFHLKGGEWCDNPKGLDAYPALIRHFEAADPELALSWQMEYMLGTYGGLKYYAWKYFEKMKETKLAAIYRSVYDAWRQAFAIKKGQDAGQPKSMIQMAALLKSAHENEAKAAEMMG